MKFRKDIQGLRGIAVLLVLFYHLYPTKLSGGFIGVDIFFVISGFLVCYSIESRINSNSDFHIKFYAARIRRLLPASILTIWVVTYYIFRFDITYFSIYKQDAIASLLIFANYNYYFNKVDYFHSGLKESPLLHYWSLSLEEQFYIISPVLVWFAFDHVKILYSILSIISLLICLYYSYNNKNKAYFFLSSRSWEFLSAALIRYISQKGKDIIRLNSNISIVIIIIISMYYNDKMIYPSYSAIFPVLVSLYTLYSSDKNSILTNYFINMIGNVSYSMYLIHFPLKCIYNPSFSNYIIVLGLCVVISYNFVEIPFYKGSFILSDQVTCVMSFILLIFTYINIIKLNIKTKNSLKSIKHYTTGELIGAFVKYQKSYCCLNDNSKTYKSSILFIGDSHIEQYIIAIFNSDYKHKIQLLHIYVNSNAYSSKLVDNYIKEFVAIYYFKLCLIGNIITSNNIYYHMQKMAEKIITMCDKVLISNDNPRHSVDPNSCFKKNKDDCYGELNKTCFIPKKFSKSNNNKIDIITFWGDNIISGKKCKYYDNYLPIYADTNHLSLFYLQSIIKKVVKIISEYVVYDNNFKHNVSCPYYHMPHTKYVYKNLNQQNCDD